MAGRKRTRTKITPKLERRILEMAASGETLAAIGEKLGLGRGTASKVVSRNRVEVAKLRKDFKAQKAAPPTAATPPSKPPAPPPPRRSVGAVAAEAAIRLKDENTFLRRAVGDQAVEIMLLKHRLEAYEGADSNVVIDLNAEGAHA